MAEVVIIGGGLTGQAAAMLLALDGHRVRVLERDPAPPATSATEAWDSWERRGVNQFRMLHYFLPRFREVVEAELPAVVAELEADGALRMNLLDGMPVEMSGGLRDEDARFAALTGRRPVIEAAVGRVTARTPGVEVRRGVGVKGLLTDDDQVDGVAHVVGVVTEEGEEVRADLVVDAGGRRSALPRLLADIGARPPVEELEDCGFVYYGRHFCSADGSVPPAFGPGLMPYDSISILTLPADNGTWGVGLVTSAHDADLRAARDPAVWTRVIASYPLVAHWLDAEPITDVAVMAKIEDRHRRFVVDGVPVATGVVPLGDSWACTNPSVGRGASIGVVHACALRDTLRRVAPGEAFEFATAWHDATTETVEPYFRDTLTFDRHRLAEIDAQIAGVPYETDDPAWLLGQALANATTKDPELLRGYLEIVSLLARGADVLSRPGVAERALDLGADGEPFPGPTRGGAPGSRGPLTIGDAMKVDVDGAGFEVDVAGDGPAVVLLHGWPDSHRLWRAQLPALHAAGFRTIAPDQRGMGESFAPEAVEDYALPILVGDVVGIMDAVGVERAHIVGHDWGAAVAWGLASFVPERVERLVALSVGHPTAFRGAGLEQRQKSWYMLLFQFVGIAEEWISADDFRNFREWANHPDADAVITELRRPGALTAGLNWYRANVGPESLLAPPPALPPIAAPTMGVWSSGDPALTERQMLESAAYVTGPWRYERIDGAGHWMQLEATDALNALLVDFLT